jgi:hypothetical protein
MRRLAALGLLLLAGCGAGPGEGATGVSLVVTDDFGREELLRAEEPQVAGRDTVMRLLQRNADDVTTRYGGGFVQSIEGRAGGEEDGRRFDWFYYINGVLAEVGAAEREVREGDYVWWDRRDWSGAMGVPAVVGSFPAPFTTGVFGDRLPTRLECADPEGAACDAVQQRLVDLGVVAAKGGLARNLAGETLRVLVGPWSAVRQDRVLRNLEQGPDPSGVFVRAAPDGRSFSLLDATGREVRRAGPGTGLIAATKIAEEQPVWTITGTDEAGVAAAAEQFTEDALRNRFALVVEQGRTSSLPLP